MWTDDRARGTRWSREPQLRSETLLRRISGEDPQVQAGQVERAGAGRRRDLLEAGDRHRVGALAERPGQRRVAAELAAVATDLDVGERGVALQRLGSDHEVLRGDRGVALARLNPQHDL